MLTVIRSTLFAVCQLALTPPFAVIALLTFPLSPLTRYRIITLWTRLVIACARGICGIRCEITGLDNLPDKPCIILSKHQSAWETLAFQLIFPPQVWVLKRELLRVPFFGWGLAMLSPIAIDRSSRREALQQLVEQGKARLAAGFYIVIFPEGTRIAPGKRSKYRAGGARLAVETGTTVVPVAHNAGRLWARNAFLKRPGVVSVRIGPAIAPEGHTPETLMLAVESWIESQMQVIDPPANEPAESPANPVS